MGLIHLIGPRVVARFRSSVRLSIKLFPPTPAFASPLSDALGKLTVPSRAGTASFPTFKTFEAFLVAGVFDMIGHTSAGRTTLIERSEIWLRPRQ